MFLRSNPLRKVISFARLWTCSFPYINTSESIEPCFRKKNPTWVNNFNPCISTVTTVISVWSRKGTMFIGSHDWWLHKAWFAYPLCFQRSHPIFGSISQYTWKFGKWPLGMLPQVGLRGTRQHKTQHWVSMLVGQYGKGRVQYIPALTSHSVHKNTVLKTWKIEIRRTKSGKGTPRSAHESLDARPGNQTELSN